MTSENGNDEDISSETADTVITDADLSISKVCQTEDIRVGDDVTYLITVTNAGDAEARNVVVEDVLDTGMVTLVSVTKDDAAGISCSESGGTVTWTIAEIAADSSVELTLVVNVNEGVSTGETLSNKASITSENGNDADIESETASDEIVAPDLAIVKTVDKTSARAGDTLTYTITVTNNGTGTGRDFIVEDVISDLVTLDASTLTTSSNVAVDTSTNADDNTVIDWTISELGAGESVELTFSVVINAE
ncbi:MAG: DUF11 domain-containing protein [Clostridiales bacterium]|nr:DUF11 domain-containing protein [Clostridiales bacterium]